MLLAASYFPHLQKSSFFKEMVATNYWGMAIFNSNEDRIRQAFNTVHKEFDEHLETINANTEEICENRYMLNELSERISKLSDDISVIKEALQSQTIIDDPIPNIELSLREQEVFLVLYMHESGVSYSQVARHTSLPISVVQEILYDLIAKGVPVVKQRRESELTLLLDLEFRELQSKHNVVGIDEKLSKLLTKEMQLTLLE
jgi:hypothetical protein